MTSDLINLILELSEMLLSFQIGFSFVSTAVVCAVLAIISCFEPSSVMMEPSYLKVLTDSSFFPIGFDFFADPIDVVGHQLSFFSTDLHAI